MRIVDPADAVGGHEKRHSRSDWILAGERRSAGVGGKRGGGVGDGVAGREADVLRDDALHGGRDCSLADFVVEERSAERGGG